MRSLGAYQKGLIYLFTFILFIVVTIAVTGCNAFNFDDPKFEGPPNYQYKTQILGLENYSTPGGIAPHIMVPVPEVDGRAIVPFKDPLAGKQNIYSGKGPWNSNAFSYTGAKSVGLNQTPYGLMLDITVNETDLDVGNASQPSLSNISIFMLNIFGPVGSSDANYTKNELISHPLYPTVDFIDTPYTIWVNGRNISNYTTYLYIDEGLTPISSNNQSIDIYLQFGVESGYRPWGNSNGDIQKYVVKESIPANVTGFIPVRVQYAGLYHGYFM